MEMKTFLLTLLGAITANTLSYLFYQGFVQSRWGKDIREEITRWFNQLAKFVKGK